MTKLEVKKGRQGTKDESNANLVPHRQRLNFSYSLGNKNSVRKCESRRRHIITVGDETEVPIQSPINIWAIRTLAFSFDTILIYVITGTIFEPNELKLIRFLSFKKVSTDTSA